MPFGRAAVTLYHRVRTVGTDGRSRDTWQAHLLTGCFFQPATVRRDGDTGFEAVASGVCRIPFGTLIPAVGDVIAPGACDAACTASEALRQYEGAFPVQSVTVRGGEGVPLGHIEVTGG